MRGPDSPNQTRYRFMYLFKQKGSPLLFQKGKYPFLTILGSLACLATPSMATPLSYEESRDLAIEQAGFADLQEIADEAARARRKAATALPNPSAFVEHESLDGAIGTIDETVAGVSTRLDFLWKRTARIESADRRSQMATHQLDDEKRRLAHEVTMSFIAYGNIYAELETLNSSLQAHQEAKKIAESLVSNGDIPPSNLRRIELTIEQLEIELVDLESRKAAILASFSVLTGMEDAKPSGQLQPDQLPFISASDAIATAQSQRADLLTLESYAQWQDAEVARNRAESRPEASLDVAYKSNSDDQSGTFIGLSLELPIFGESRAQTALAMTEQRRADLRVARARRIINGEVTGAFERWQRLLALKKERTVSKADQRQNEAYLNSAAAGFEAGESTLMEYLDALRTHLESRRSQLAFSNQLNLATAELAHLTGSDIPFKTSPETLSE
ncbi:MAG TPA: TolC family protein [Oceanipulchritudo sp.]|nr:TolC family protein [Oceanipulchritudo sp.]